MSKRHGEFVDNLFLHCSIALTLGNKLFGLAKIEWVPPRSVMEMLTIACQGFGGLPRENSLWGIAILMEISTIWWKRNARIF